MLARRVLRGAERTLLATPAVVDAVRAHTGCATADGAELESAGGAGTSGSHLEDTLFFGDVMCGWIYSTDSDRAPTAHGQAVMSNVSLAVLQDLGFYSVDWESAGALVWAAGAGCGVVEETCEQLVAMGGAERWYAGAASSACTPDRCACCQARVAALCCGPSCIPPPLPSFGAGVPRTRGTRMAWGATACIAGSTAPTPALAMAPPPLTQVCRQLFSSIRTSPRVQRARDSAPRMQCAQSVARPLPRAVSASASCTWHRDPGAWGESAHGAVLCRRIW